MEHALYRHEKTKIIFEYYWPIYPKLYRPTFNYSKFYAIYHFVQCIQNYGSIVNQDISHNKTAHKYLLKTFFNKTKQKKYDLQIWQYNVGHTNIIAMKDIIAVAKRNKKKRAVNNREHRQNRNSRSSKSVECH